MTALIASAAISPFAADPCTGAIGVVNGAIRREDRHLTLTREATGHVTRAGRWLARVQVRVRATPPLTRRRHRPGSRAADGGIAPVVVPPGAKGCRPWPR
jgi:hypothetical protein